MHIGSIHVDYNGKQISPELFLAVISGNSSFSKGRVINSTRSDNVFIFYSDHGAPGVLLFPNNEVLHAVDLVETLHNLSRDGHFNNCLLFVEACYGASMFKDLLKKNERVLAVSSADAFEESWACFCEDWAEEEKMQSETNNKQRFRAPGDGVICLGDEFSVGWMENVEMMKIEEDKEKGNSMKTSKKAIRYENENKGTVKAVVNNVKQKTKLSRVCVFGQKSILNEPLSSFFKAPPKFNSSSSEAENEKQNEFEQIDDDFVDAGGKETLLMDELALLASVGFRRYVQEYCDECKKKSRENNEVKRPINSNGGNDSFSQIVNQGEKGKLFQNKHNILSTAMQKHQKKLHKILNHNKNPNGAAELTQLQASHMQNRTRTAEAASPSDNTTFPSAADTSLTPIESYLKKEEFTQKTIENLASSLHASYSSLVNHQPPSITRKGWIKAVSTKNIAAQNLNQAWKGFVRWIRRKPQNEKREEEKERNNLIRLREDWLGEIDGRARNASCLKGLFDEYKIVMKEIQLNDSKEQDKLDQNDGASTIQQSENEEDSMISDENIVTVITALTSLCNRHVNNNDDFFRIKSLIREAMHNSTIELS
eukprot:MONOS_3439.1-p1 / transcript=MONOS_3439.1 / gene=MONOS_3439 / organism=Monocercomonoides_exilis_PA203 / gene_product=legumain-1 / transcript_product=legumain-1 / location=Mono_scaffold00081:51879-53906(-) / protein_length=595 / sequence_SO=supercontig / SO=protein_coding / is_pseudo=false